MVKSMMHPVLTRKNNNISVSDLLFIVNLNLLRLKERFEGNDPKFK